MMVEDPIPFETTGLDEDDFARCQRALANSARSTLIWKSYFKALKGEISTPEELQQLVQFICTIAGV